MSCFPPTIFFMVMVSLIKLVTAICRKFAGLCNSYCVSWSAGVVLEELYKLKTTTFVITNMDDGQLKNY